MSVPVDVDAVDEVLIAGTWYAVADQSFEVDAYRYSYAGHALDVDLGPGYAFVAICDGVRTFIAGPMTALQAVRVTKTATS